jgi:hypothetical protein
MSPRARRLQAAVGDAVCAAVAAVMAWRIFVRGLNLLEVGETTLLLGVGRGYIAVAMAAMLAATAAVFLYGAAVAARSARARP